MPEEMQLKVMVSYNLFLLIMLVWLGFYHGPAELYARDVSASRLIITFIIDHIDWINKFYLMAEYKICEAKENQYERK